MADLTPLGRWLALGLCLILAPLSALAEEQPEGLLYRYVDSRGVTVMDRQGVPPEYVGQGYQVLNAQGRVVKVVPPAPTAEEIREAQQAEAQANADAQFLQQYRSVADVDRARTRRLAELDALIGVAQGNLQGLSAQQVSLQGQAADQERAGRPVPQSLIDQMHDLREQQQALNEQIQRYQDVRRQTEIEFAGYRARVQRLVP